MIKPSCNARRSRTTGGSREYPAFGNRNPENLTVSVGLNFPCDQELGIAQVSRLALSDVGRSVKMESWLSGSMKQLEKGCVC